MQTRIKPDNPLHRLNVIVRHVFSARWHSWVAGVATIAMTGAVAGFSINALGKQSYLAAMTHEAETMLELTSSYVAAYSGVKGIHDGVSMPVPAEFRATASDLFNKKQVTGERLMAKMVGVPEREIVTPPDEALMVEELLLMMSSSNPLKISELIHFKGEPVLRSMFPSIASEQSCVDCHNQLQPGQTRWQLGDLMGAYVIDRGVKKPLQRILSISILLGLVSSIVALLVFLMIRQHVILRHKSSALQSLANTDPLTGCLNRRALYQQVANRFRSDLGLGALLALDIDHFKKINDRYGHAAGDEVLVQFATRVRAMLRESDIFARTGGEEFLIYLPNVRSQDLDRISARIVESITATSVCIGSDEVAVSVSIGAVKMVSDNRFTFEHYMKVADSFLYRAKQTGRNRVFQIQPTIDNP